ncbi:MAG: heavy metal-associated domain-containing protein [Paracoccaceae bacterium]
MTTLSIPDMTCGHCRASVESAIGPLPGVEKVTVDLANRTAQITGPATPASLIAALDQIGFPAQIAP